MNTITPDVRMVGFIQPLESPIKIPAGSVVPMSAEDYEHLRAQPNSDFAICNLTMKFLSWRLGSAFSGGFVSNVPQDAASSIASAPCPHCSSKQGISLCKICGGTRRTVFGYQERSTKGAVDNWNALQDTFRKLAKSLRLAG